MQTLSHTPVVSLLERHTCFKQQDLAQICSSSQASCSPVEPRYTGTSAHQPTQPPILIQTGQNDWPVAEQHPQPEPIHFQSMHSYMPHDQLLDPDLSLSDDPLSPHGLESFLNMPALSLDSRQHSQDGDRQAETPQSQSQSQRCFPHAAQQYLVGDALREPEPQYMQGDCQQRYDHAEHLQQQHQVQDEQQHCHSGSGQQQYQSQHDQQHYHPGDGQQQHQSLHEHHSSQGGREHQQYKDGFCTIGGRELHIHHSFPLASDHAPNSLQLADPSPVPMAMPNIIRKTSSDSTIE